MKVRLTLTGTAPMLMHNIQLADPLNAIARAMKEISSKRKKTDEDQLRMAELEFKGGLYITDQLGPYVPGVNVEKCLGATRSHRGLRRLPHLRRLGQHDQGPQDRLSRAPARSGTAAEGGIR